MTSTLPKDALRFDAGTLRQLVSLAGTVPRAVRYAEPGESTWPRDGYRHDQVHEVSLGVEITTAEGSGLLLSWATQGEVEGISAEFSLRRNDPDGRVRWSEAGATPQWTHLLGHVITDIALAVHMPTGDPPQTVWAVRLGFEAAGSAVIALGEAEGDTLAYHPRGLVVIFDEAVATAYRIPGSDTSSWGTRLDPEVTRSATS
jgi:hypothetical protein